MEENNKKGFNTLYLVLGVSTLVVAIIGATFAFFSASQTNDNVIKGDIAEAGGLVLNVESITYDPNDATFATTTGNAIIPLNLITNQTLKENSETEYVDADSQFAQAMAKKCRDDLGNNICEVYKITVQNQSTTATVQIRGRLKLTSTATNMYWKLIDATTTTDTYTPEDTNPDDEETPETQTFTLLATGTEKEGILPVKQSEETYNYLTVKYNNTGSEDEPVYVAEQQDGDKTKNVNVGENVTLAGSGSATYYVVVWLEEIGAEQQNEDASPAEGPKKTYQGIVTFDAVDAAGNKSGVTATFLS